jgi:hypothetical protein
MGSRVLFCFLVYTSLEGNQANREGSQAKCPRKNLNAPSRM